MYLKVRIDIPNKVANFSILSASYNFRVEKNPQRAFIKTNENDSVLRACWFFKG